MTTLTGIIGGAPQLTSNFLEVYVTSNQVISATNGSAQTIIYNTIVQPSAATTCNTTTGVFTMNYPGKYLFNMKIRQNTSSGFSPPMVNYCRINNLSQGFVGNHWDVFMGGACNNFQTNAVVKQIIEVPSGGETCVIVVILAAVYGGGSFPVLGTLAQGTRSTVTYLGQ